MAALVAIPGFGYIFALPVVRKITEHFVKKILTWLVDETSIGLSVLWIALDMQYEVKNAEDARRKLSDMLLNPAKYSHEQEQEISGFFDETTIDLIQLELHRLADHRSV